MTKRTKADRLRQERDALIVAAASDECGGSLARREAIRDLDRQLNALARRRQLARARRELLYDLNGHHGPA